MRQKRKPITADEFALPEGARQSLASFGVTEESAQDDFFRELAGGLQQVADIERALGLRPEETERA